MKRCAIIVAVTAGLLWNVGFASAQYRTRATHTTMSGHNTTMSGQNLTNHNHLTPQRVGVITNPYTAGVIPAGGYSPYTAGAMILPNGNGGFQPGTTVYPGGNYYNPAAWNAAPYSSGTSGFVPLPGPRRR